MDFQISGNIVDLIGEEIFSGTLFIENGIIREKIKEHGSAYNQYILPGLIDSHIHIESSMLTPSKFARLAVIHGTVASVSDPHEIANVLGMPGIEFMLKNGKTVPFKFYFGAPSCVPATGYETSGAHISSEDIEDLFLNDEVKYLSEMMNYPGVMREFPDVINKLALAKKFGKPVDGHAPGLRGDEARKYISSGISTDHECYSIDEALEKISYGMKILIREGSAAKNFEALHPLLEEHSDMLMFCSDDKHPDDLVKGHINEMVKRAIALGYNPINVLKTATVNPIKHYNLDVGLLQKNEPADFIIVDNLIDFNNQQTYINGNLVAENGKALFNTVKCNTINNFKAEKKSVSDFEVAPIKENIRVIEAMDGQLITNEIIFKAKISDNNIISDMENDNLKIAVVNRYENTKPAIGFIKNIGLKLGAIASSVAHDSHNIIAVGTTDEEICNAVNAVIESKGGMDVTVEGHSDILELPIAGLMSNEEGYIVAEKYAYLTRRARELGSGLHSPFMTLSFMALLVIPKLKLSDKGLFDGEKFEFVDLQV